MHPGHIKSIIIWSIKSYNMAFYLSTPNKKPTPCRKDSFESDLAYLEQQIIMRD